MPLHYVLQHYMHIASLHIYEKNLLKIQEIFISLHELSLPISTFMY